MVSSGNRSLFAQCGSFRVQARDRERLLELVNCGVCSRAMWRPWMFVRSASVAVPSDTHCRCRLVDCGHSYCHDCLENLFDAKNFSCPACRKEVVHRPVYMYAFQDVVRDLVPVDPSVPAVSAWSDRQTWSAYWVDADHRRKRIARRRDR